MNLFVFVQETVLGLLPVTATPIMTVVEMVRSSVWASMATHSFEMSRALSVFRTTSGPKVLDPP